MKRLKVINPRILPKRLTYLLLLIGSTAHVGPRPPFYGFHNIYMFHEVGSLAPRSTPNLEDQVISNQCFLPLAIEGPTSYTTRQ
jgi:hypothetical protein